MQDMHFVTMALRDALEQHPAERPAILRGFHIVLNDQVRESGVQGVYEVQSQSHPDSFYDVSLHHCDCKAASSAHGGRCLHRYAVGMFRRAAEYAVTAASEALAPRGLVADICDPTRRVARELAGFPGPTARHM